jgi:hypothetical protein
VYRAFSSRAIQTKMALANAATGRAVKRTCTSVTRHITCAKENLKLQPQQGNSMQATRAGRLQSLRFFPAEHQAEGDSRSQQFYRGQLLDQRPLV